MGARVLVVDDDPWILRMVTATLEKRRYVVDTAREGQQALERARANPPDVIITDVMMPVMDGWTFVAQLRMIPQLAAIPVIMLTALGKDDARLRSLGLGPEDYLPKPFRFDDLEKRVSAALARAAEASGHPESGDAPGPYPAMRTPVPATPVPGSAPRPAPYPPPQGQTYESHVGHLPVPPGYPGYGQPGYPAYPYGAYPGYPQYPAGGPYPGYPAYPPGHPAAYPPRQPGPGQQPPGQPPPGQGAGTAPPVRRVPAAPQEVDDDPTAPTQIPRRTTALNGRLEQLQLSSLLVMMEMERKGGVLTLKDGSGGDTGRIFLRGGQVICAKLDGRPDLGGRECVYEMLRWKGGNFSFNAMEVEMEDTVKSSTTHLLMEGARLIDEANRDDDFL